MRHAKPHATAGTLQAKLRLVATDPHMGRSSETARCACAVPLFVTPSLSPAWLIALRRARRTLLQNHVSTTHRHQSITHWQPAERAALEQSQPRLVIGVCPGHQRRHVSLTDDPLWSAPASPEHHTFVQRPRHWEALDAVGPHHGAALLQCGVHEEIPGESTHTRRGCRIVTHTSPTTHTHSPAAANRQDERRIAHRRDEWTCPCIVDMCVPT